MKKKSKRWLTILIVAFLGIIGLNFGHVHADDDDDYKINQMDVDVIILPNGDAEVTRSVLYDFENDFHGVYYRQELPGKGASGISVDLNYNDDDSKPHHLNVPINDSGKNNTCKVVQNNNLLKFRVYHEVSDNDLTVTYHYIIHGAVTNYKDAARLNWKVIGNHWDVPLHNVTINIWLPGKLPLKWAANYVWYHGPMFDYHATINSDFNGVQIQNTKIPENDFVEADMLIPLSLMKDNSNKKDSFIIKKVVKQEKKISQNEAFRKYGGLYGIPLLMALFMIGEIIFLNWKGRKKKVVSWPHLSRIPHNFEIPAVSVPLAQMIWRKGDRPDGKAFSGYLLSLVAEHRISFDEQNGDYRISIHDDEWIQNYYQTNTADARLLKSLFEDVGDGTSFTLKAIKDYDDISNLAEKFNDWQQDKIDQLQALDVFSEDENKIEYSLRLTLLHAIGIAILVAWVFEPFKIEWVTLAIPIVVLGIYYLYFKFLKWRLTANGKELYVKVVGFKKMIDDITHFDTAQMGDLTLWADVLPYATAFGNAKELSRKLRIDFGEDLGTSALYNYFYFTTMYIDVFSSAFHNVSVNSGSSWSAFDAWGDSFGGGSSGGFGGGSGGGAF